MPVGRKADIVSVPGQVSAAQIAYLKKQKQHKRFVKTMRILILLAFFLLWEWSVRQGWIDGFIFSSPIRIWKTMISMATMIRVAFCCHDRATRLPGKPGFFLSFLKNTYYK